MKIKGIKNGMIDMSSKKSQDYINNVVSEYFNEKVFFYQDLSVRESFLKGPIIYFICSENIDDSVDYSFYTLTPNELISLLTKKHMENELMVNNNNKQEYKKVKI